MTNLLAKLRVGNRKRRVAREICVRVPKLSNPDNAWDPHKDIAIILWALDDYATNDSGRQLEQALKAMLTVACADNPERMKAEIHDAALKLSDTRVTNFCPAILAICSYIAAVSANFIKVQMSKTIEYHLPHTIAWRELFYWFIPAIALRAIVGSFPSQETSLRIIKDLATKFEPCERLMRLEVAEPWDGGDYYFRLKDRNCADFLLASLAVSTAFSFSICISYFTPTVGVGCRGLAEILFFGVWFISPLINLTAEAVLKGSDREFRIWTIVGIKDFLIAVSMLTMLLLPFLGTCPW